MAARISCTSACVACACLALIAGCSPQRYRESADGEVYSILATKTQRVPGMAAGFTIEQSNEDVLAGCPRLATPIGAEDTPADAPDEAPLVISLEKALEIAALNSRDYQTQKEALYLEALSLTLERHDFAPQLTGSADAGYDNTGLGNDEEVSGGADLGLSWLFATGTQVTVGLASGVSQFLTGDPRKAAASMFNLSIAQPLLQGAGVPVNEPLIQAERDVIYEMRDFVRFRRRFFVNILSDYYGVLRERQILENERLNYENLVVARRRAELMADAGKLPEFQVDQTRQDELRAEDRVESAQQSYESRLDEFKTTLGLPAETALVLDASELERLGEQPGMELDWDVERAVALALERRLDLATARDRVADAERKEEVARNDLLPGLDLSASLDADTDGANSPADFHADGTDLSVGLELDLPLDKKGERNQYRSRLISLQQSQRQYDETRDGIVLEVRDAWRQHNRAMRSYEIQKASGLLAERRVKSTMLLLEAGRADTRDMLEAHEALVQAQNALARALVDYRVARLELARSTEIISVGAKGQLEENFDEHE